MKPSPAQIAVLTRLQAEFPKDYVTYGWAHGETFLSCYIWTETPNKPYPKVIAHVWEEYECTFDNGDYSHYRRRCVHCGLMFEWDHEIQCNTVRTVSIDGQRHPTVREFESCTMPVRVRHRITYKGPK
jgi:hypothetical protein